MKKLSRCLWAFILSLMIVITSMPSDIYAYTYASEETDKSSWKLRIEKNNNSYSYGSYLYRICGQNTGGGSYTFTGTLFDNDAEQWKKEGICLKSDVAGWAGTVNADKIRIYDNTSVLTKAMYYGFNGAYGITDENNYAAKWAVNYIRDTLEQRYINAMVADARGKFGEDETAEADAAAAEAEAAATEALKSMSTNELLANTGLTGYSEALTVDNEVYLNDVTKLTYLFTHHGGTLAKRNYDDGLSGDSAWIWAWEGAIDSGEYVSGNTCLVPDDWSNHRAVGYVQSYVMEVNQLSVPKGVYTIVAEGGADQDIGFLVITPEAQECLLEVYKQGELLESWDGNNFVYSTQYLAGATFRVTAAENIVLPDGTVEYAGGTTIADIITGEDGKATLNNIHAGKYTVTEISAPDGYLIDSTPKTVTITENPDVEIVTETVIFTDIRKQSAASLTKKSEEGSDITGAEFTIYAASDIKNASGIVIVTSGTALQTVTTNAGKASFTLNLPYGNSFYIKETKATPGYMCSGETYTFECRSEDGSAVYSHEFINTVQKASLSVFKEGETLTGWNGNSFVYELRGLSGAAFQVSAAENITKPDGTVVYPDGTVIKNIVTGSDGRATLKNIYPGTYKIQEISAPDGYVLNDTVQTVTIAPDQNAEVAFGSITVTDTRKKASVSVTKKDSVSQYGLSGTEFTIYAANDIKDAFGTVIVTSGTALQTVTSVNGTAAFTVDLPYGNSFTIKETNARDGYILSKDSYSFTFDQERESITTFTHEYTNDRVKGELSITKTDSENISSQGDATLCGAVYGLYASEDIISPDGSGEVLYVKDELLGTLTTDAVGTSEFKDIPLGNYYLKEISSSEGYLLDPLTHEVSFVYEGGAKELVSRNLILNEDVKKQAFQLIKVSGSGDELETTGQAGFTAYLKSTLKVKEDGSYDFENSTPVIIGENGETTLYTDENGYLCSIPLPYGTYIVRESVVPHGLSPIAPFTVNIVENNTTTPQQWRIFVDKAFSAKIKIVKKDRITGRNVLKAGTEFQVYKYDMTNQKRGELITMTVSYPSPQVLTSFKADEDGELLLPESLPAGTYAVYEITAPYGYLLDPEPIIVTLNSGNAYEIDGVTNDILVTAESRNYPVMGEIKIIKQGEVLADYKEDFSYKVSNLVGAVFEVYASEDIIAPDKQTDENGEIIVLHHKGELIDTVITDENGCATVSDLYLGSYDIKEVTAPEGYTADDTVQKVTLSYVDQYTATVSEEVTFLNQREKVKMQAVKTDAETGDTIAGAEFGLYAYEDIRNAAGDIVIPKDTQIETAVSDDSGVVNFFEKDYPFAAYYVKEITPPDGYLASDDVYIFNAEPQADTPVIILSREITNVSTKVIVHKNDMKGDELSGATLSIQDKNGNIVETWTSNGEGHVIRGLSVGETYTLKEEFAPYGYLRAEEVKFTVTGSNEAQEIIMKDNVPTGIIIINKDGEILDDITVLDSHWYDFIYKKKSLSGVTFEVYNADTNTLVDTIVTNELGIASLDNLELGDYYLVETKTNEGFILDSEPINVSINYIDQDTPVITANLSVNNKRQKVSISVSKKDSETNLPLAGAVISLYTTEDILSGSGKVLIKEGTKIAQVVTGEDGAAVFTADLPLGNYIVREEQPPEGYIISDQEYAINASFKEGEEIQEYFLEFMNEPVKEDVPDDDEKTDIPINPGTGDDTPLSFWIALLSVSSGVLIYCCRERGKTKCKKTNKKKRDAYRKKGA